MKVIITQPVEHDGKMLDIGPEVDLPKAAAEALLACGSAEDPAARRAAEKAERAAKAKAEKLAALDQAVSEAAAAFEAEADEAKREPLQKALDAAIAARKAADDE